MRNRILVLILLTLPLHQHAQNVTYTELYNDVLVTTGDSSYIQIGSNGGGIVFVKTNSGFTASPLDSNSALLINPDSSLRILDFGDSINLTNDEFRTISIEINQEYSAHFGQEPTYLGFYGYDEDPNSGLFIPFIGYIKVCASAGLDSLRIREIGFKRYWYTIAAGEEEESNNICFYWPSSVQKLELASTFKIWPNPNQGSFILDSNSDNYDFQIVDLLGRQLPFTVENGNYVTLLTNESGIFFILDKFHEGVKQKIVVNRN